MKKVPFLLLGLMLIVGCTTAQSEPTSTPMPPTKPPTEPPPPTSTSIPPTQAPNPHAEEVFLALAEAINNQDYAKARTFFSEDITMGWDEEMGFVQDLDDFISDASQFEETYDFNEFVIAADEVEFKWFVSYLFANDPDADPRVVAHKCYARATMEEDKILTLRVFSCAKL